MNPGCNCNIFRIMYTLLMVLFDFFTLGLNDVNGHGFFFQTKISISKTKVQSCNGTDQCVNIYNAAWISCDLFHMLAGRLDNGQLASLLE